MNPTTASGTAFFKRRWVRWIIVLVLLVIGYAAAGFWLAPRLIRSQLLKQLPPATHRNAEIGVVEVNPFRLSLTISNLNLTEPNGERFASWERFHANLESSSLWRRALVLREVTILRPFVAVERQTNGGFNFANLIPTNAAPTNPPPPAVEISSLQIEGGQVALRDRAVPGGLEKQFSGLAISFTNFSTRTAVRSIGQMSAQGDPNERVTWTGDIGVSPLASAGALRAQRIQIPRNGPYVRQATTAVVTDGEVDLSLDYSLAQTGTSWDAMLSNSAIVITNLVFKLL